MRCQPNGLVVNAGPVSIHSEIAGCLVIDLSRHPAACGLFDQRCPVRSALCALDDLGTTSANTTT